MAWQEETTSIPPNFLLAIGKAANCLWILYNERRLQRRCQRSIEPEMAIAEDLTQQLLALSAGDEQAPTALMPLVYDELRRLAKIYLSRERQDHTLQPTALVHEAYLRLIDQTRVEWQNRAHFFGVAAAMMRRILIDYARQSQAEKRGGQAERLALDDALAVADTPALDLLALDDALSALAKLDPRQSRIVELRFFGGLTLEETAEVMHLSRATIEREWLMAKAWLYAELKRK